RHPRPEFVISTLFRPFRFLYGHTRDLALRTLDRTKIFIDPRIELLLVEIPDDDQHSIIGPIKRLVKLLSVSRRRGAQLIEIPDHAPLIRMLLKRKLIHQPEKLSIR